MRKGGRPVRLAQPMNRSDYRGGPKTCQESFRKLAEEVLDLGDQVLCKGPMSPKILTKTRIAILLAVPLAGLIVFLAIGLGPSPLPPRPLHVRASGPLGNGWQKYDLITSPGDWDQKANGAPVDFVVPSPAWGARFWASVTAVAL